MKYGDGYSIRISQAAHSINGCLIDNIKKINQIIT